MEHHLVYKDSKSDKFWNIKVSGKSFTVTYGKSGTTGQTQIKKFDSEEKCLKEAEKLLKEKRKKGYTKQIANSKKGNQATKSKDTKLNKEEILSLLKSSSLPDVEKGINALGLLAAKKKSEDDNPIYTFFDLDKDDFSETELIEVKLLDTILSNFKTKLSAESLIAVVRATMGSDIGDNFSATLKVVHIAIDRKDVTIQNAIVETFKKACKYYDAGHRYYENTVQDQLIEKLFPQFEGEPLVNLLTWCKTDFLHRDYDAMDALFKPAFKKIKDNKILEKKLLSFFSGYIEQCGEEYKKSGILEGFEGASVAIKSAIKKMSSAKGLDKLIADYHRKDKPEPNHYEIIVNLRNFNHPKAIQLLIDAMNHERNAVIREAIYSLGHLKAVEAVPHIIAKLKSKDGQHITAAAFALSQIKSKECLGALRNEKYYKHALKLTKDEDEGEGRDSVAALKYFDVKNVNNDLLNILKSHDDYEVQEGAVKVLIFRAAEDIIEPYASYIVSNETIEENGRTLIELILGIASRITTPNQKHIKSIAKIFDKLTFEDLQTLIEEAECPLQDLENMTPEEKKRADNWCRSLISNIQPKEKRRLLEEMLLLKR